MRRIFIIFVMGLFALAQASCGNSLDTSSTTTSLDSAKEVAEVVAISAGGISQAVSNSAPNLSSSLGQLSELESDNVGLLSITGFTFDSQTGVWTGTTQFGATPSLEFYLKSDGTLITVDVTDDTNYEPDGELFGVIPINETGAGIQMQVTVVVNKTFNAGYTLSTTIQTEKVDGESQNIGPNASYSYTGTSGTVTGDFGTITLSSIALTASDLGANVEGSYTFTVTAGNTTYNGTAQFDENGCKGATVTDETGTTLGTAVINESGGLIFTDAGTGETTTIPRIEG